VAEHPEAKAPGRQEAETARVKQREIGCSEDHAFEPAAQETGNAPKKAAISVERRAAAGARSRETRVP